MRFGLADLDFPSELPAGDDTYIVPIKILAEAAEGAPIYRVIAQYESKLHHWIWPITAPSRDIPFTIVGDAPLALRSVTIAEAKKAKRPHIRPHAHRRATTALKQSSPQAMMRSNQQKRFSDISLSRLRSAAGPHSYQPEHLPPPKVASAPLRGAHMRRLLVFCLLAASALPAAAQSTPPANPDAKTPAVNSPNSPPNAGAPAAGANSFTEGQAKSRIEDKGFKDVSGLKKDDAGVWRGKAMQGSKSVNVSVDFQGNVVAQ